MRKPSSAALSLLVLLASSSPVLVGSAASAPKKEETRSGSDKSKGASNSPDKAGKAGAGGSSGTLELAKFADWGAYMSGAGNTRVCFALSQPKERTPKGLARDPAYIFLTSRPGQNVRNELSFIMGYALKGGVDATATVDGKNFALEAKEKTAFVKNAAEEARIVEAMKTGSKMSVKGTSLRGNDTSDSYSLSGLGKALEKLQTDCK